MGTGDVVAAPVGELIFLVDDGQGFDGGGGTDEELASGGKGRGPGLGQGEGIALAVQVHRVGVHLVREQVAGGHRPQGGGRVRPRDDEDPAWPLLQQGGIAGITGAGGGDQAPQLGGVVNHGRQALLGPALGEVDGGLHHHHGDLHPVDDRPNPVVADLGARDLGGFLKNDALDMGVIGMIREAIHDLAREGHPRGAPAAGFGGALGGQAAMLVGPLGDVHGRNRGETVNEGQQGIAITVGKLDAIGQERGWLKGSHRGPLRLDLSYDGGCQPSRPGPRRSWWPGGPGSRGGRS